MFLLDTMVVSERTKSRPNAGVVSWYAAQPTAQVFVSAISLGEIIFGVRSMPPGRNQTRLASWLTTELPAFFAGRVLAFDEDAAHAWGDLRYAAGRTLPHQDSMIAAIARTHRLTVVTRNVRDFSGLGVPVLNPWT